MVAEAGQVRVEAEEPVGGRDVVVDRDEPVRRVVDEPPGRAPDREMEEADRVGGRDLVVLPERPRAGGHAGVDALGEDVGFEAGAPEVTLDREGLVADGVAVGERGQDLVDPTAHAALPPRARCEEVQVLPLDDVPGVVFVEVATAVPPQRAAERFVGLQQAEGLAELVVGRIVESRIGPLALASQHLAVGVGEDGTLGPPRLQSHHGEALVA